MYQAFRSVLKEDGHINEDAALSSWDFAVATRASAPRVETHFQFWRTTVNTSALSDSSEARSPDALSVWCEGHVYSKGHPCEKTANSLTDENPRGHHSTQDLDFDRIHGHLPIFTVYADVLSPDFPATYVEWLKDRDHAASFRLRYKPTEDLRAAPLPVTGYGVELALKRTDYIVIDDRETKKAGRFESGPIHDDEILGDGEDVSDIKPLSSSELRNLGVNTASLIMSSNDPLGSLLKVSRDFPMYSSALAQSNATIPFITEHQMNREVFLRSGLNVLWLNGQQLSPREIDAFSLLDTTRRERNLVKSLEMQGLSPADAIGLITHPTVATAQSADEPQRYDYMDKIEGGDVIVWLNDLEKDKRYADWPVTVDAFLQRMFPGQLPSVRKNAHTVIYLLDFSDPEDISDVVENLQNFVKRTVPVRFGIVPIVKDESTQAHAKIFYHLQATYGLSGLMRYLQECLSQKGTRGPSSKVYETAVQSSKIRNGKSKLTFDEVLGSDNLESHIARTRHYVDRLRANDAKPPVFANGVPIPRGESWMQALSQRLSLDLRTIQQAVFEASIDEKTWIPSVFLNESTTLRDPLLIPEDEKNVTIRELSQLYNDHSALFQESKTLTHARETPDPTKSNLFILADFNQDIGLDLVVSAVGFGIDHPEVEVCLFHVSNEATPGDSSSQGISKQGKSRILEAIKQSMTGLTDSERDSVLQSVTAMIDSQTTDKARALANDLGLKPGDRSVLLNGRQIGPLQSSRTITIRDLELLYEYERKKRLTPVAAALDDLNIRSKLHTPMSVAEMSSTLAIALLPSGNEGVFERPAGPRTIMYNQWYDNATCIKVGDAESSPLHFVAVLDPSSETAQQWIPILEVLTRLDGVYMRIFLNPQEKLQELPTKRFYRYVLPAKPAFDENGDISPEGAIFKGIPRDALLTMTMDVPPPWLVAPKRSIYDLDNIKLSSVDEKSTIEAHYELQNILIEGHSRDVTLGTQPRGAQLILGTQTDPDLTGTIIMANLGYFQFKANPGIYDMKLKHGASDQIYSLVGAGTRGFLSSHPSDSGTQITLSSFKGATVFPRLSRKPGMELEDVLETEGSSSSIGSIFSKGAGMAENVLAMAGIQSQDYVAKFADWLGVANTNETTVSTPAKHADINIFSVASGHLYERMLNIMILSVMHHTEHTVKFWFIEQFLSPSFKIFLPTLAAEYGFDFEMVTYKWPHWLRAQQEKQRTIWGYKILFLDVLFPLDLDKVIFVDADQIVRTDMYDLVQHDLEGAPYGFTPMCDSRVEMEGFRFWKQGYWENFLRGKPYHISALYVVDLKRFRQIAAGDRLRQQYHSLSADPGSLSNLDQDLPNHMQHNLHIHSLPQEWLWCETWCSDESLKQARTIDLCNNPQTKEPKLDRARRQVPEWTAYDDEIAELAKRMEGQQQSVTGVVGGHENTTNREGRHLKDEL